MTSARDVRAARRSRFAPHTHPKTRQKCPRRAASFNLAPRASPCLVLGVARVEERERVVGARRRVEHHEGVVRAILEHQRTQVNYGKTDISMSPLVAAAQEGREGVAKALLETEGIDVNKTTNDGVTPLCSAAEDGHAERSTIRKASMHDRTALSTAAILASSSSPRLASAPAASLAAALAAFAAPLAAPAPPPWPACAPPPPARSSEARRAGNECRSRWSPYH